MNSTVNVIVSKQLFGWPDYVVFVLMLMLCIFIGIYFGFIHVSKDVSDYLVGGRNMTVWPITISLVTSYISAISFLGLPTEIYVYGIQYMYINMDVFIFYFLGKYVFLTVFMELQLTSMYEYLEKRFNISLRRFGSALFLINSMCWLPLVIYVPALALNQVTAINVHIMTPIISGVCIFYTCLGGIRAVIWTDFLQAFLMIGSVLLVLIKGTINVGGLWTVIERNYESGRLEWPDFELSLTKRLTAIGMLSAICGYIKNGFIDQIMVQRYVSLPSQKHAEKTLKYFLIVKTLFYCLVAYSGLLIFATYYNCDPISTQMVKAKDQLLPLLVVDTLGGIPGAAGLFLAGVFSASLSSLSSGLNSMAAVILEDFYKPMVKKVSPKCANLIVKGSVLGIGVLTVALAFIVEKLGTVLQLSISLGAITSGPLLGIFTLGVLLPRTNSKGALLGGIGGILFMAWVIFGNQAANATGAIQYPTKPVSVEGCSLNHTLISTTTDIPKIVDESEVFYLFRITFLYYSFMGTITTLILGVVVSYLTGFRSMEEIDIKYLSPCIRKYYTNEIELKKIDNNEHIHQDKKYSLDTPEAVILLNQINEKSIQSKEIIYTMKPVNTDGK